MGCLLFCCSTDFFLGGKRLGMPVAPVDAPNLDNPLLTGDLDVVLSREPKFEVRSISLDGDLVGEEVP